MLQGVRPFTIAAVLALVLVGSATASWAGKDPRNTPMTQFPDSCFTQPGGAECVNAGVYYLDKARARVGLPPYALPANFATLSPPRQFFILVNLDRIQYGLPPFPGMTAALNHDALVRGVWTDDDPQPSNTTGLNTVWPGWAGAFYNAPMAYEVAVWDDGLGSTNPRCTPTDHSRCWGHRHSVLWKFPAGSTLAMGAAAGRDHSHRRSYAWIFVGGSSAFHPKYSYTWAQAVADGAGTNTYDPGTAPGQLCQVPPVEGLRLAGARRAIVKAHCTLGTVVKKRSGYPAGLVVWQHPAASKTFPPGTAVRLNLSSGP